MENSFSSCTFSCSQVVLLLISIIVVWYFSYKQLREIKNELWLSVFSKYTTRYENIIGKIPFQAFLQSSELTDEELSENLSHFRAYFNLCSEEFYLNRAKKIEKMVWFTWDEEMRKTFRCPSFKKAWKEVKEITCYDDRFITFVENIMYERKDKESN